MESDSRHAASKAWSQTETVVSWTCQVARELLTLKLRPSSSSWRTGIVFSKLWICIGILKKISMHCALFSVPWGEKICRKYKYIWVTHNVHPVDESVVRPMFICFFLHKFTLNQSPLVDFACVWNKSVPWAFYFHYSSCLRSTVDSTIAYVSMSSLSSLALSFTFNNQVAYG